MRIINKSGYYYLQHSYSTDGDKKIIEEYLGKEIPKNILRIKNDFMQKVFMVKFREKIDIIKRNHKKEFLSLPKTERRKYLEDFAIRFTYNSEAIEGSTLNLKDTVNLLRDEITPRKPLKDIIESREHNKVFLELLKSKEEFDLDFILNIHRKLFIKTYPNIAGKIRNHNVRVVGSNTVFTHHAKLKKELREFINWYKRSLNAMHPFMLAVLVKFRFVNIHPFTDGNGRVSRILMNYILYKNQFPLIDIKYLKRNQYYNALEKSNERNEEFVFVNYISKKFIRDYKEYLE